VAALITDPGQFDEFDMAMARMPQEIREGIEQDNNPKVDSFLEKMVQDDAWRFFLAARMRAFGAKTLKELLLMQREYSLKGLAEKIQCPTLVWATTRWSSPSVSLLSTDLGGATSSVL